MEPSTHFFLTQFMLFSVMIQIVKPQHDDVLKIRQDVDRRRKVLDLRSKLHALQEQFTVRQRGISGIASETHKLSLDTQQRDVWGTDSGTHKQKLGAQQRDVWGTDSGTHKQKLGGQQRDVWGTDSGTHKQKLEPQQRDVWGTDSGTHKQKLGAQQRDVWGTDSGTHKQQLGAQQRDVWGTDSGTHKQQLGAQQRDVWGTDSGTHKQKLGTQQRDVWGTDSGTHTQKLGAQQRDVWGTDSGTHTQKLGTQLRDVWGTDSGTHKQQRDTWGAATEGTGEGKLRLVDGTDGLEGRLEVFHDGQWGTVCDDDFNIDDARVACRQMGYSGGDYIRYYKAGSGRIWMSNLRCQGTETRLADCRFGGWGEHLCRHWQDVAISCDMSPENADDEDKEGPCDITAALECFDLLNMANRRSFTRASRRCSSTYPMFLSCVDGLQFACLSGPLGTQITEEREAIANICGNTGL